MSARAASWLAWSFAVLCVAVFVAIVMLHVLASSGLWPQAAIFTNGVAPLRFVALNMPFLAFALVGALISARRPRNAVGWICIAVGLLASGDVLGQLYVAYGLARPGSVPFVAAVVALTQWAWVLPMGLLGTFLLLLFPDGSLLSDRWRPLAWLSGAIIVLLGIANVLAPGPLTDLQGVRNPFGIDGARWLVDAAELLGVPFAGCILASAASLVARYRRSGVVVREQIKWIALAGSVVGMLTFFGIVVGFFLLPEGPLPPWFTLLMYALGLSVAGVPVAITFAVLKYRLYDIDVVINRTLVYGPLTVSLALAYFGGVTALQGAFRGLTGQESNLAVVASTLAIAALFSPLRRRMQSFIDRRFYRRKYDSRRTLEAYVTMLRDETALDELGAALVGVVGTTMQPAHVSLWLRAGPSFRDGQTGRPSHLTPTARRSRVV